MIKNLDRINNAKRFVRCALNGMVHTVFLGVLVQIHNAVTTNYAKMI